MDSYAFRVVIEKDEDVFHAYCPGLKGCHSWGYTQEEAMAHIREATEAYVEDLIKAGESIPAEAFEPEKGRRTEKTFLLPVPIAAAAA